MILISACLLGLDTKYDGKANANQLIMKYCREGCFVPVCPEQLGGLTTPRHPAEIVGGQGVDVLEGNAKVLDDAGNDVTNQFLAGSEQLLRIVDLFQVTAAIMKERSPSCGVNQIYDGSFSHNRRLGQGVSVTALRQAGITVVSEEELTDELMKQLLTADIKKQRND